MSFFVNLLVSFRCDENEGVAELAKNHLPVIREKGEKEAIYFLEELSQRTGSNFGLKGGMSLWGMVENHTDPDAFVACLNPFWDDLLRSRIEGGPLWFQHIVVFYELEDSDSANVLEIYLDGDFREQMANRHLTVKKHEQLPFHWR